MIRASSFAAETLPPALEVSDTMKLGFAHGTIGGLAGYKSYLNVVTKSPRLHDSCNTHQVHISLHRTDSWATKSNVFSFTIRAF
jgi:hypothetical protein